MCRRRYGYFTFLIPGGFHTDIILDALDASKERYIHIRSEQLVGAAIGVWIKSVHLDFLSDVSFAKVNSASALIG